jgi:prophage antirepressor-like protein
MKGVIFMEEAVMVTRRWADFDNHCYRYVRFIKIGEEWWAVLKDICDSLGLQVKHVSQRIDPEFLLKRSIRVSDTVSTDLRSRGDNETRRMTLVNEYGIYQCISGSRKLEARKFNKWWPQVLGQLRKGIGLQGYQALELMNEEVQEHITKQIEKTLQYYDYFSDVYYDENTGKLMMSKTVAGGDVEQVPYDGSYDDIPEFLNMYSQYVS